MLYLLFVCVVSSSCPGESPPVNVDMCSEDLARSQLIRISANHPNQVVSEPIRVEVGHPNTVVSEDIHVEVGHPNALVLKVIRIFADRPDPKPLMAPMPEPFPAWAQRDRSPVRHLPRENANAFSIGNDDEGGVVCCSVTDSLP